MKRMVIVYHMRSGKEIQRTCTEHSQIFKTGLETETARILKIAGKEIVESVIDPQTQSAQIINMKYVESVSIKIEELEDEKN